MVSEDLNVDRIIESCRQLEAKAREVWTNLQDAKTEFLKTSDLDKSASNASRSYIRELANQAFAFASEVEFFRRKVSGILEHGKLGISSELPLQVQFIALGASVESLRALANSALLLK